MIKKITYFLVTGLLLGVSFFAMTGQTSAAPISPEDQACEALGAASGTGCDPVASGTKVDNTIALAINVFSFIVGVAAVIMIIIGGLKYVMSNGDSNSINSAKNTILYAIIGLVVVAMAQIVVKFVLNKSTAPACTPPAVLQSDGTCS